MNQLGAIVLCANVLAAVHSAQVSYVAPAGMQTAEANYAASTPWSSGSATYMQVHAAWDLAAVFPSSVTIIKGLGFRKDGVDPTAIAGRTMDVQITMATTSVTAANASESFAANLGPAPLVVMPYATVSLPPLSAVGQPNPLAWRFPFVTPYVYVLSLGNLCWEMRIKNGTSTASAPCDAFSGSAPNSTPVFGSMIGTGCSATGQTFRSSIGVRSLIPTSGVFTNVLYYGRANSQALMVLGATPTSVSVPGLCGVLHTVPLAAFQGPTDANGNWQCTLHLGSLLGLPSVTAYTQFAWLDAGLGHGFGLSDCAPVTLPPPQPFPLARIQWSSPSLVQGWETAISGVRETYPFGLVTGFDG